MAPTTTPREAVEQVVRAVLQERFESIHIESIDVNVTTDEDGDEIYLVNVVFDGDQKRLDSAMTTGLARRILPKIQEMGAFGFPILSFIAKSDLRTRKAAAV